MLVSCIPKMLHANVVRATLSNEKKKPEEIFFLSKHILNIHSNLYPFFVGEIMPIHDYGVWYALLSLALFTLSLIKYPYIYFPCYICRYSGQCAHRSVLSAFLLHDTFFDFSGSLSPPSPFMRCSFFLFISICFGQITILLWLKKKWNRACIPC